MTVIGPQVWRWLTVIAAVVVAAIGLFAAGFTAGPGEIVLLERSGHVVAGPLESGLHWRVPLVDDVVRLDAGVHVEQRRVQAGAGADALRARYTVLWKVGTPRRYYQATGGDASIVNDRLGTALAPILRRMMNPSQPDVFLTRPAANIDATLATAAREPAAKLGIDVLNVALEDASVPSSLQQAIGSRMAAGYRARAAGSASSAAAAEIATGRARARAVVAAAHRAAGEIRGRSEAQVAEIFARAGARAPSFFRFYQQLTSEERAMSQHTRALVISTDSPWFKLLRDSDGGGKRRRGR